jgi:small-conductance mechanosensitive channel
MRVEAGIATALQHLDTIGFDIGSYRISLYRAIITAAVLVGIFIAGKLASRGARWVFRRQTRLDPTEQLLGEKLLSIVAWVLCIVIGADIVGIDLTAFAVFSGAFGLALGFGLQKTFGNLLAGIILLMDRSIKPGDVIAVAPVGGGPASVGQVQRIGLRAVSVITRDKIEFLIPNENLMVNQVENWSFSTRDVRVKVPVGVAYGSDVDLVERLMLQASRETERVLADPPPAVWLNAFGDNAIMFEMQIWIDDPEDGIGNVRSDVLKRLWHLFREHGVEVPFPQRDIHIREWPDAPKPAGKKPAKESSA